MKELHFDKNGDFRIMILGDVHEKYESDCKTEDYINLIEKSVDELAPDLVVFMGDLVSDYESENRFVDKNGYKKQLDRILSPILKRNILFATVFGNHDSEAKNDKKALFEVLSEYPGFICTDEPELTGCGNCNVTVKSYASQQDALNLWFIDSGSSSVLGGYANVEADLIRWYENTCDEITESNKRIIPAFLFQHIPVPEEYLLLKKTNKFNPYAVKSNVKSFPGYYTKRKNVTGYLGEAPCTPDYNGGQFLSWKKKGDIVAAFFGHDHQNDFDGEVDGIRLIQNKCTGFHIYGDGLRQGVRLVAVNEKNIKNFSTKMYRYRDFFGTKCNSVKGWDLLTDRTRTVIRRAIMTVTSVLTLGILSYPVWLLVKKYI